MLKKFDINEEGYSVRCWIQAQKDAREYDRVVICTHGFGGSKDAPNISKFAEKETAKYKKDAVICFDWPCHGQDARKKLELSECLEYLGLVIRYSKEKLKAKTLLNYSVSFGAYLTLEYIAERGNPFAKIALRCPGIKMYDLMRAKVSDDDLVKLSKGKEVMVGFDRKMKVDQKFMDDLKAADVTKREYFDWADDMLIIQGTNDHMVSYDDSKDFAENNVINFVPVEGADHTFRNPKLMDMAIHTILEFFGEDK
ncbi:MAG: alpha/beta hydrolase [Eubacteriales bacterium]|nr:alpha/beta hydrolase [Eubacteriales bacterium]